MNTKVMASVSQMVGVAPAWAAVLAVIAHPDEATLGLDPDEGTFGLGVILDAFVFAGTRVEVLCLTHGQAWTLPGAPGDLAALRGAGLPSAADVLGPTRAKLPVDAPSPIRAKMQDWSDGALCEVCQSRLAAEVVSAADSCHPDGLLVFDTAAATDRLDYVAASAAGLLAADTLDLPVLAWALCETVAAHLNQEFNGSLIAPQGDKIDLRVSLERTRQRVDSRKLPGPAPPGSPSWRRLERLADIQSLRWLRPPSSRSSRTARYRSSPTTSAQEWRP